MASLYSLPEHLVGVLHSLLDDEKSQHAFRSSSSAVRRAPSVLSQITSVSVSAEKLRQNPGINPLACLPAGVRLQTLEVEFGKDVFLVELLTCPRQEGARVQESISNLQALEVFQITPFPEEMGPWKEPSAFGACVKDLPLRRLVLQDVLPGDVLALLRAMGGGSVVQSLESLTIHDAEEDSICPIIPRVRDPEYNSAITAALVPFKCLSELLLDYDATNFTLLKQLPALKRVYASSVKSLFDVLPHMPHLEMLYSFSLPSRQHGPTLRSASLKVLNAGRCDLDTLDAALDCACQGALPGLREIGVDETSIVLDSIEGAQEIGTSIAAKLCLLPHMSARILNISDIQNLDAFLECCLLTPGLWRETRYIHRANAWDSPPTRLHELPRVFPCLEEFRIQVCWYEEILGLCDAVSGLGNIQIVSVTVRAQDWSSGIATSIMSLCMHAFCSLAGSGRAGELCVVLLVESGNGEVSEEQVADIEVQLSVLRRSWAKSKAALEKLHGPSRMCSMFRQLD